MREKQLAQAYVPCQRPTRLSTPERSLKHGTIFPDLFFPYEKECELHKVMYTKTDSIQL